MGLHWAWPALQSLIPEALFRRLQTAQVDPNMPVKDIEHLPFINGATGELLFTTPADRLYRFRRSKICKLLAEGLEVHRGKKLANITYSTNSESVTAHFEDGTSDEGWLLIGADGPHSMVRRHLVGEEKAKVTPIGYAATMCFSQHTREHAIFLRSPPFNPLYQCAVHPAGYFSWTGLHDASDPEKPETWTFFHYISFLESRDASTVALMSTAEHVAQQKSLAKQFADPFKSVNEWMSDSNSTASYTKLQRWDPRADGHHWDNHDGCVTLAGDAAHPMTFQRGQGLNHAITDALKLVQVIENRWHGEKESFGREQRIEAIGEYENEMIPRSSEEIRVSEMNTRMMHDWEKLKQSPVMTKGMTRN